VKLGDLAYRQGKREEGNVYYRQAVALGDSAVTAPALMALGIDSFKDRDVALGYFQRALNADADGPTAGPALTWMARVREDDGAAPPAVFYTMALGLEPEGSPARALTLEMLARLVTGHAALGDVKIQNLGNVAYPTQAEMLQAATAEAQRIRAQRVADLSRPLTVSQPSVRVGGGVTPPKLLLKIEPEYAPEARALKIEGQVALQVTIDVDGSARDIKLMKGLGYGLDEAAALALSKWKFEPGARGGAPVPVMATIEVNFRLL
jgi:TonB family protein